MPTSPVAGSTRRSLAIGGIAAAAIVAAGRHATAAPLPIPGKPAAPLPVGSSMLTVADGTRTAFKDWGASSPWCSATASRSTPTRSRTRCSFWHLGATAASRRTAAGTVDPASRGPGTTWTRLPTIWRAPIRRSASRTQSTRRGPRRWSGGARLTVYQGAPHGLCVTHKDRVNSGLLAFLLQ